MKKSRNRMIAALMALIILSASMAGCKSSQLPPQENDSPEAETSSSSTPSGSIEIDKLEEDEVPEVTIDVNIPNELEKKDLTTAQFRLYDMSGSWKDRFNGADGFHLISSTEALAELLQSQGIDMASVDLRSYDADFFKNNRLAVIAATSNSGSYVYTLEASQADNVVKLSLGGSVPGSVGTTDMADWLVFAALPVDTFGEDTVFTLEIKASPITGNENLADK